MNVLPKALLIGFGALALTTLTIKAVDELSIRGSELTGSLSGGGACAPGMSKVSLGDRSICVDRYEASPSSECPYEILKSSQASEENFAQRSCEPVSVVEQKPWTYVSLTQAQQLCARAGKRLPSAAEWYAYSLGVTDESRCVLDAEETALTGVSACVNDAGVHDTVGNVWEWVAAEVVNGVIDGKTLPVSGFVNEVDLIGMPLRTKTTPDQAYGNDYVTTDAEGIFGVVRGGFYGSGSDGGLFSVNTAVPHSIATPGIGFRCVQDLR